MSYSFDYFSTLCRNNDANIVVSPLGLRVMKSMYQLYDDSTKRTIGNLPHESISRPNVCRKLNFDIESILNEKLDCENITSISNLSKKPKLDIESISNEKPDFENLTSISNEKMDVENPTSISSEKPDITSISSEKPNFENLNTISSEKPDISSISSEKPDISSISSEKPDLNTISSEKPDISSISSEKPDITSISNEKPDIESLNTISSEKPDFENLNPISSEKPDVENLPSISSEKPDFENLPSISSEKPNEKPDFENLTKENYRDWMSHIEKKGEYTLSCSNMALVKKNKQFEKLSKNYFDAFVFDRWTPVDVVNRLVCSKTEGLIPSIFRSIPEFYDFVLVNVVFFKGFWEHPFHEVKDGKFVNDDGTVVDVPMMQLLAYWNYAVDDKCAIVELPYRGGDVAMYVLLPDDVMALELTHDYYVGLKKKMDYSQIDVRMPKFKLDEKVDCEELMETKRGEKCWVTSVVEVDHLGTKAASATMLFGGGYNVKPRVFNVNKPFVFVIENVKTDVVLFIGRVMHLKQS